jgi:hypothetical protein
LLNGVPVVETASGGFHLWFAQPAGREPLGNSVGPVLKGLGIDIKGGNGYVIGPGAVMHDGTYYACAPGCPDLCDTFAANALRPIFPWLVELIEAPAPGHNRGPSAVPAGDVEPDRARKWGEGALRRIASALAMVREGNRNNELNSAVFTLAGKAVVGRLAESEVHDMTLWACGINKLIQDDGLPAFEATFRSAWNAGIRKPLPGPRDRDNDTVKINLKPKVRPAMT